MRPSTAATVGVLVFTVLLQSYVVVSVALVDAGKLPAALGFWAVTLALHLRHLRFGLRGQRPPHGFASLAALVAVVGAGQAVIGGEWVLTFAVVPASALIVLPLTLGLGALIVACVAAYLVGPYDAGAFYAMTVAVRSVILAATVWIVAAVTELDAARVVLSRVAVIDERARADAALQDVLGARLAGLAVTASRAQALSALGRDAEVAPLLRALAVEARSAVEQTRRTVTEWRGDDARHELAAARVLLASQDIPDEARP